MCVYFDTAPVIYAVENVFPYVVAVDRWLSELSIMRMASDLTRMECRVKPLRDGNTDLLKDYDDFFQAAFEEILPLTREVMDQATEIRAQYGFKTPDAIHLSAAVVSSCNVFLTNDHRLDRFNEITIEIVQP